jgi:hypothetical protein
MPPAYFAEISTIGAGATCDSGCELQDAHNARPAAAVRMIAIFIVNVVF